MTKGVPTARSQRYKLKEKKLSTFTTFGNDVLPLPTIIPTTQLHGAQRAFATVRVLHQSLLHAASPGTHIYDLLQVLAPYLYDCSQWHHESEARNIVLQKQLDEVNAKVLAQDAELVHLQDQLKKCRETAEFYRQQAVHADVVPPSRRCRLISCVDDTALTPDQLYQQLLLARDDIQVRDSALDRFQLQHTQLQASFEQVLTSSSELLALHLTLLEQHLQLHSRLQECTSDLSTCQVEFLVTDTTSKQTNAQLLDL